MKKITIKTSSETYYFKIEEIRSGYSVKMIDYDGGLLGGRERIIERIGEAKSIDDAITLAKIRVNGQVVKIE